MDLAGEKDRFVLSNTEQSSARLRMEQKVTVTSFRDMNNVANRFPSTVNPETANPGRSLTNMSSFIVLSIEVVSS